MSEQEKGAETKKLPGPVFIKAGVCVGATGITLGSVKTTRHLFTERVVWHFEKWQQELVSGIWLTVVRDELSFS